MIMHDDITNMRDTLKAIRLELDRRNVSMKVCASNAEVGYSTWLSWFPAGGTPQVPSLAAIPALAKRLPPDLFDMLFPDGMHCAPCPDGIDFDEFAARCRAFLGAKDAAHHPDSPAGRDISPCEEERLKGKVVSIPMGKVA